MFGAYLLLLSIEIYDIDDTSSGAILRLTSNALQVTGWTQTIMQMLSIC